MGWAGGLGWAPATYLNFADDRLRPAVDLLSRVAAETPATIVDLGCGTGTSTRLLAERWPDCAVTGIDSSPEMLAAAMAENGPHGARPIVFQHHDIDQWQPSEPADVVFSNAALQWLDDHPSLFPRLLQHVAPGGWLAVQMPRNHGAASHLCMIEAAEVGPWAESLRPLLRPDPVGDMAFYHDILARHVASLDIWETEYLHVLDGVDPVVQWTRGTALKPLLDALPLDQRGDFVACYRDLIALAYPRNSDGLTLFPFRRVFVVART